MSQDKQIILSPKVSFLLGLGSGALALFAVGFFVMLGLVLKGSGPAAPAGSSAQAAAAAAPSPSPSPSAAPSAAPAGDVAPVSADDHIRGDKNAELTLIEYSDFECPFCGRFHPTMKQLMQEYEGQVRWVYRHFPLSFHAQAMPAAIAAECAGEQNKFWEFADKLFENQPSLGESLFKSLAGELGLNQSKFESCLDSNSYRAEIQAEQQGGSSAGVTGTPGTFIVDSEGSAQLVPGALPYEQVKAIVDQMLQ